MNISSHRAPSFSPDQTRTHSLTLLLCAMSAIRSANQWQRFFPRRTLGDHIHRKHASYRPGLSFLVHASDPPIMLSIGRTKVHTDVIRVNSSIEVIRKKLGDRK